MSRSWWRFVRPLGGAAILVVVVAQMGSAPFRDALRALDAQALALGALIGVWTTACAAWRWRLVADRLHIELSMSSAVAAYYRSQFLNLVLPGGVLGDVDRGVQHGRGVRDVRRALRAVAWERTTGQVVAVIAAGIALLLATQLTLLALILLAGATVLTALLLSAAGRIARNGRHGRVPRVARVLVSDGRELLAPRVAFGIVVSSLAVVSGHVATFVVAARTVGVDIALAELVPLALLVLLVAAVPLNLAGWGPREGAAAWAFAAVGGQAAQGLAVAVAYGAIVLVAALPGLGVILVGRSRPAARVPLRGRHPLPEVAGPADAMGVSPGA